ncbi:hypothetical protein K1719_000501 [Acacia pycnantha]|nr:hypothetical protein K1719_000501 [Acacia pycnantha]
MTTGSNKDDLEGRCTYGGNGEEEAAVRKLGLARRAPFNYRQASESSVLSSFMANDHFEGLMRGEVFGDNAQVKRAYMHEPPQKAAALVLAYFHIPLPEYASFDSSNFTVVKQEGISSASVNSDFFTKHLYECIHYLVFIPDQICVMVKLKFILTNQAVRICFLSLPLLRSVPHMTMTEVPECSWPFVYTSNIELRVVLHSMICFHIHYVTYLHVANGLITTTVVSILSLKRVLFLL